MDADDLSLRLQGIREEIIKEATNKARDASTDFSVGKFNFIEHRLIPDINRAIEDIKIEQKEMKAEIKHQKDNVKNVPYSINKIIYRKLKTFIMWPSIATLIAVAFFLVSLIAIEDLRLGIGETIFETTQLDQVIARKIGIKNNTASEDSLNFAILELVTKAISEERLEPAILKVVADTIYKGAIYEGATSKTITLLDDSASDTVHSESELVAALKRFISLRKEDLKIFETPQVAESVNQHEDYLTIFDNRVSVAYAFSKEIRYQEEEDVNSTLYLPLLENALNVNCVFEFSKNSSIPGSIDFVFENRNRSYHTAGVPKGVLQSGFLVESFVVEKGDLLKIATHIDGPIEPVVRLKIQVPAARRHLYYDQEHWAKIREREDKDKSGDTQEVSLTRRAPDLTANCFVEVLGQPKLSAESH